jgi:hypothetical protein
MFIADIDNPFRAFLSSCGKSEIIDLQNVPATSKDCALGMCEFMSDNWIHYNKISKLSKRPVLFIISLDGIGSDNIYKLWEENRLLDAAKQIIPEYILDCNNPIVLFDNSAEGHCDNSIFNFISQVTTTFGLDPSKTFYCNSAENIVDIHNNSVYKNDFRVFFLNNYKEDTMADLFQKVQDADPYGVEKTLLFSCLNNAPRPHRALLLGGLIQRGLHVDGMISSPTVPFNKLFAESVLYLGKQHLENRITQTELLQGISYLEALEDHYPLVLDRRSQEEVHMKSISQDKDFIKQLKSCEIDIITETFVDYTVYVTEKIYKPIIMKQPFMILGSCRTFEFLRKNGYKTFDHLYNDPNMFDKQNNVMDKINMILAELETLQMKKDSPVLWQDIQSKNIEITEHNFNNFISKREHIDSMLIKDVSSWLEIYPGFTDVFSCYNR